MHENDKHTIRIAGTDAEILSAADPMQLSCGESGCVITCCKAEAPIILNPYEIDLICQASGMAYEDLLDFVDTDRANGFPLVMLLRSPACHFWTENGCRIYHARPLACRLFPLGRVFDEGASHFVLPEMNCCPGLVPAPARTIGEYLRDQDAQHAIEMADLWIEFVSAIERMHLPDAPVTSVAFHMLVYSPDTPPSSDLSRKPSTPEERFILRLESAMKQLPKFLLST